MSDTPDQGKSGSPLLGPYKGMDISCSGIMASPYLVWDKGQQGVGSLAVPGALPLLHPLLLMQPTPLLPVLKLIHLALALALTCCLWVLTQFGLLFYS